MHKSCASTSIFPKQLSNFASFLTRAPDRRARSRFLGKLEAIKIILCSILNMKSKELKNRVSSLQYTGYISILFAIIHLNSCHISLSFIRDWQTAILALTDQMFQSLYFILHAVLVY